jgi:hypothetical protein
MGEETFGIWLGPLELVAVDDEQALVVTAPAPTRAWVATRFGRGIAAAARSVGRGVVIADPAQEEAIRLLWTDAAQAAVRPRGSAVMPAGRVARVDRAADRRAQGGVRRRSRGRSRPGFR